MRGYEQDRRGQMHSVLKELTDNPYSYEDSFFQIERFRDLSVTIRTKKFRHKAEAKAGHVGEPRSPKTFRGTYQVPVRRAITETIGPATPLDIEQRIKYQEKRYIEFARGGRVSHQWDRYGKKHGINF